MIKKKLFLAASFSVQVDYATGKVNEAFRQEIEAVIAALREVGFEVFSAMEYEGWVISNDAPEVGVKKDLAEIDAADVLLALLHDPRSPGTQFELGYAVARGKQVLVATPPDVKLAYFSQGLANANYVTHLSNETPELLAQAVKTHML
jgi:nucleoside 2-deoxyribosyltransferase